MTTKLAVTLSQNSTLQKVNTSESDYLRQLQIFFTVQGAISPAAATNRKLRYTEIQVQLLARMAKHQGVDPDEINFVISGKRKPKAS